MAKPPSSMAENGERPPWNRPIGVRAPATMTERVLTEPAVFTEPGMATSEELWVAQA